MSNPKQVTTVRMTPAERAAISGLAESLDRTESAVISRLIPTGAWPAALLLAAQLEGEPDALDMPSRLMAGGLRRLMERDAHGIKAGYLDAIVSPDEIARLFLEWADGSATHLGVKGNLGNRFRLMETEHGWLPVRNESYTSPAVVLSGASLESMLESIKSTDAARRIEGGFLLSQALLGGGALHGSDPSVADLISRAISCDPEAVEELERIVTSGPAAGN